MRGLVHGHLGGAAGSVQQQPVRRVRMAEEVVQVQHGDFLRLRPGKSVTAHSAALGARILAQRLSPRAAAPPRRASAERVLPPRPKHVRLASRHTFAALVCCACVCMARCSARTAAVALPCTGECKCTTPAVAYADWEGSVCPKEGEPWSEQLVKDGGCSVLCRQPAGRKMILICKDGVVTTDPESLPCDLAAFWEVSYGACSVTCGSGIVPVYLRCSTGNDDDCKLIGQRRCNLRRSRTTPLARHDLGQSASHPRLRLLHFA